MKFKNSGFEDLHKHSDFSLLDGFGQVEEYANRAKKINQQYLCISDHGMMAAVPRQIRACDAMGLKPIFACELYLQDKHVGKEELSQLDEVQKKEVRKSYHLLAIARSNEGYQNLVQLTSWAFLNGFYYKPRVTHEQLRKHKKGIIFTSCCYNGEIGQAFDRGGADAACSKLEQYIEMFGKDNFYLELMMLDFNKQKPYDEWLIKAHEKYGVPLIITNDCHYCNPEDSKFQRYMLMIQTGRTEKEIMDAKAAMSDTEGDFFELQDTNLWLKSEDELNEKWLKRDKDNFSYSDIIPLELFEQAKRNTVEVCKRVNVEVDRSVKLPQIPDADLKFREACVKGFKWRGLTRKPVYERRLKQEFELICRKGFSSYFMIQQEIIQEARRICPSLIGWGNGDEAIGPGRGCLKGDVRVVLANGCSVPISDVKNGDQVFTIDGSVKIVENTLKYKCDESLINIKTYYGDNKGVSLTTDHKVYVERVRKLYKEPTGNLEWIPANEIKIGDWMFIPKPIFTTIEPEVIDLSRFVVGIQNIVVDKEFVHQDWINPLTNTLRRRKTCSRYVQFDARWAKLLGVFTGDGWLRADTSPRVGFAFHSKDVNGIREVTDLCLEYGWDFHVSSSKVKKLTQVLVNNKALYSYFKHEFYKYKMTSQTKHVPDVVFTLPEEMRRAFLEGYRCSDGHCGKHKSTYTTSSCMLASQIRVLSWQCGIPVSMNSFTRTDKRSGFVSNGFSLNYPEKGMKNLQYRVLENGILVKVRDISVVQGDGWVYDLTIAENHNYLTTSFLVHNSAVGSLVCYCLGITDVDPVRHGLLFDRFLSESRGGRSMKIRFTDIPLPE